MTGVESLKYTGEGRGGEGGEGGEGEGGEGGGEGEGEEEGEEEGEGEGEGAPIQSRPRGTKPFATIETDIKEPLQTTFEGFRYP